MGGTTVTERLRDLIGEIGQDQDRAAWPAGYVIGFVAGLTGDDYLVDEVQRARDTWWAGTLGEDDAAQRWAVLCRAWGEPRSPRQHLRACGLLTGWKAATEDRPDAQECLVCEARLLTDREGVSCGHGWFCDEDHQRTWCGTSCGETEFDDDLYYAGRYVS